MEKAPLFERKSIEMFGVVVWSFPERGKRFGILKLWRILPHFNRLVVSAFLDSLVGTPNVPKGR
jgi:hypothetical protein